LCRTIKFNQVVLYIAGCEQLGVQIAILCPGQYRYIDGSFILTTFHPLTKVTQLLSTPLCSQIYSLIRLISNSKSPEKCRFAACNGRSWEWKPRIWCDRLSTKVGGTSKLPSVCSYSCWIRLRLLVEERPGSPLYIVFGVAQIFL
jgi:hypothetical protein